MAKIQISWSKLLPFNDTQINKLGDVSGVYRLSKKEADGKFYVFFVGSAENIKTKLLHHLTPAEENLRLKAFLQLGSDYSFRYADIPDKGTREAIEKQLYKHYLPPANTEEPLSDLDIEANIN